MLNVAQPHKPTADKQHQGKLAQGLNPLYATEAHCQKALELLAKQIAPDANVSVRVDEKGIFIRPGSSDADVFAAGVIMGSIKPHLPENKSQMVQKPDEFGIRIYGIRCDGKPDAGRVEDNFKFDYSEVAKALNAAARQHAQASDLLQQFSEFPRASGFAK